MNVGSDVETKQTSCWIKIAHYKEFCLFVLKCLCLVLTPIYSFYQTCPVPTVERENGSGKFVKRIEKQALQSYCLVLNLITQFF